jgi:hypothetical protein
LPLAATHKSHSQAPHERRAKRSAMELSRTALRLLIQLLLLLLLYGKLLP